MVSYSFEPDRMWPQREKCVSWNWVWRSVSLIGEGSPGGGGGEGREPSGWVCRWKGVAVVIGFWLTAAGATCIWFDWTLAHPQAAVHTTEHADWPSLARAHAHTHTHRLSFVCSPSLCLSHSLLVTKSFCLLSAHALLRFPLPFPLLSVCFSSLSDSPYLVNFFFPLSNNFSFLLSHRVVAFLHTVSANQWTLLSKSSLCLCELSTFLERVIPVGAEPWTPAPSGCTTQNPSRVEHDVFLFIHASFNGCFHPWTLIVSPINTPPAYVVPAGFEPLTAAHC